MVGAHPAKSLLPAGKKIDDVRVSHVTVSDKRRVTQTTAQQGGREEKGDRFLMARWPPPALSDWRALPLGAHHLLSTCAAAILVPSPESDVKTHVSRCTDVQQRFVLIDKHIGAFVR